MTRRRLADHGENSAGAHLVADHRVAIHGRYIGRRLRNPGKQLFGQHTQHPFGLPGRGLVRGFLGSPDPGVRAAAVQDEPFVLTCEPTGDPAAGGTLPT